MSIHSDIDYRRDDCAERYQWLNAEACKLPERQYIDSLLANSSEVIGGLIRCAVARPIWITVTRPDCHQHAALFKKVGSPVSAFRLTADLVPHRLLDNRMREAGDLFRPGSERQRKPCAVIGRLSEASIHFSVTAAFIRFRSTSSAMLENGLPGAWPGNT
jgi:hypothetical protein